MSPSHHQSFTEICQILKQIKKISLFGCRMKLFSSSYQSDVHIRANLWNLCYWINDLETAVHLPCSFILCKAAVAESMWFKHALTHQILIHGSANDQNHHGILGWCWQYYSFPISCSIYSAVHIYTMYTTPVSMKVLVQYVSGKLSELSLSLDRTSNNTKRHNNVDRTHLWGHRSGIKWSNHKWAASSSGVNASDTH